VIVAAPGPKARAPISTRRKLRAGRLSAPALRQFTASSQRFAPGPFFSRAVCGNCFAITAEKRNKIKRSTTTFKARERNNYASFNGGSSFNQRLVGVFGLLCFRA
jgi:hypothetical protein